MTSFLSKQLDREVFFIYVDMRILDFWDWPIFHNSLIGTDRKQRTWQVTDYNKGRNLLECLAFTNLQIQIDLYLSISCN